jgi:Rad3-related DNA helicase
MGRAIRHANDFAALIFMDSRYESTSNSANEVVCNLPEWMTFNMRSVKTVDFSEVFQKFFSSLMADFEKRL